MIRPDTIEAPTCQRCIEGLEENKEAQWRVMSDIIDLLVCRDCAKEAKRLGLDVQIFMVQAPFLSPTSS